MHVSHQTIHRIVGCRFGKVLILIFPVPLDVFWYKDMVEIFDLAEDDRCELTSRNGKHAITMYNVTKSDAGPYLCIAINEQGQCSRHFKLEVKGQSAEECFFH